MVNYMRLEVVWRHRTGFFVAHLAFMPCEQLSSLFVRRPSSTFHILIFSSETTGPIATKLWWNGPWMVPFQTCVRWSRLPTKMAAKIKIAALVLVKMSSNFSCSYMARSSLTYIPFFLWNFSFSRFIPIMQIRHILIKDHIKSSPLKPLSQIKPNLVGMVPGWVPFKNVSDSPGLHPSHMATVTKNRNFFKWPKLLYFKPECAQIWTV
jgi:hypothetical protein